MAMDGEGAGLRMPARLICRSSGFRTAFSCALLLLAIICASASAAVITWSGMESSAGWSKLLGNWPTFDNAVVHSGANSMKFVSSSDRVALFPTPTSGPVALRLWFYDADISSLGGTAPYIDMRGGGTSSFIGFALNSSLDPTKYHIRGGSSQGNTNYSNGSVTRTPGWHRIELLYKEYTPADHRYTVLIDNAAAYTGSAFTGSASFDQITVCNGAGYNPCTPQFRVDSLALLGAPRQLAFKTGGGAVGQIGVLISTPGGLQTGSLAANHTDGLYDESEQLTITAPTVANYTFSGWSSDCGGTFGDTSSLTTTYTGATTDGTVTANYSPDGYVLTLQANPAGSVTSFGLPSGTVLDGGQYIAVSATAAPGYTFSKWTDDPGGTHTVSTSLAFIYQMPHANTTLYCWCTANQFTLTIAAGNGGTVQGDSGTKAYQDPCSVTAAASPNFRFICWSTTASGSAPVSDKPNYVFSMPASNYSLYAIFGKAIFYDGFDARASGILDSNSAAGPNKSTNGDLNGNPWAGPYPDNLAVVTGGATTSNSGGKMVCAPTNVRDCHNVVNLAFRCNNGNPLMSNLMFDWYFYDPKGSGAGSNTYNDYAALCLYPSSCMTGASDYVNANNVRDVPATQRIAVGAWNAGDFSKYHVGVSSSGGSMTWSNTSAARSVGWHHGRIAVGAANDVRIYIDDMYTPVSVLTAGVGGFNAIELMARGNLTTNATGYFDDISVLTPGTQSIDRWLTIGHYTNSDQPSRMTTDYFAPSGTNEASMSPWPGQTYNGKTWAICNGGVVNWNQLYGDSTTGGASYLFTYINNPGAPITDADLTCGSDDGIKVWLNGSVVINQDVYRGIYQNSDRYGPFTLPTGISRLLVKVTQSSGDCKAQVKITRADGTPLSGVSYFTSESVPPSGSVVIDGGASTAASQNVVLTLSASDSGSGVATMSFSNDNTNWSAPEPYATSKQWVLSVGNGQKTVYVRYTDYCGNSVVASDNIQLAASGYALMLPTNPSEGGWTTGSAFYESGSPCHITATANEGYSFAGWSTDQAGANVVSTSNPYDFPMPAQDYTLYAQFTHIPYTLTVQANAGGTLGVNPSGPRFYGESVSAVAVPDTGYCFTGWTASSDGSGASESLAMAYTFEMPESETTLYANFAPQSADVWIENFERYAAGDIDMNGVVNTATNGNLTPTPFASNPWFGAYPADCEVQSGGSSPAPHGGSKMLFVPASGYNGQSAVNLAYRLNADRAYSQSISLDWFFYDPNGTTNGSYYRDFAGLASYPRDPVLGALGSGVDYDLTDPSFVNEKSFQRFWQQYAAIGASWDTSTGYDPTKYQIHVGPYSGTSIPGSYSGGWCNTSVTRSVGWHHARISVGPVKAATGTSDISFYVDDMATPVAVKDSICSLGFNAVSVFMKPAGYITGYMDDFGFGPLSNSPVALPATPGSAEVQWNWQVVPATQSGSRVYDASVEGNLLQTIAGKATTWTETGLTSNTQYSRWVSAYGAAETQRTELTTTTLALSPNGGSVGIYTPADNWSFYTPAMWPGFSLSYPSFGDMSGRISKFKYKWSLSSVDTIAEGEGTDWSGGSLDTMPLEEGTYWIYFRSYNSAGVGNPDTLRLGPYSFGTNPNRHLIVLYACYPGDPKGEPYGPGSAVVGEQVTVHADPNPGYTFTKWTRDGCDGYDIASTEADYSFVMTDAAETGGVLYLIANYTPESHTLTVNANAGGTAGASGTYATDEWIPVTAVPSDNYRFKCWSTDTEGQVVVSTNSTYWFNMPPNDYTLYANFEYIPLLTLIDAPAAGGTASGGDRYNAGQSVSISAAPDPGYRLLGWSSDPEGFQIVSTSNPYNFTMPTTDLGLYAQYVGSDLVFQDSFENGLAAWNNISTAGAPTIVATDHNIGTHSLRIDDIGIRVGHIGAVTTGPLALRLWLKDPGPGALRSNLIYADMRNGGWGPPLLGVCPFSGASFYQARGPLTSYQDMPLAARLVSDPPEEVWNRIDIASDGAGSAHYYVNGVLTKTLTGVTPAQMDRIYLGNGMNSGAMDPAYFDDIAFFTNPRLLTMRVNPEAAGMISGYQYGQKLKGATTGCYYSNERVRLAATPAEGFGFTRWVDGSGVTLSTSSEYDLTMPGVDLTVTAEFEPLNPYVTLTLRKNIDIAGEVSGDGDYMFGDEVIATATANAGYRFVKWSSDAAGTDELSASPDYLFTITQTMTIYAIYAADGPEDPPANTSVSRISDLWPLADSSTVYGFHGANAKVVSAVWSDGSFWIQELDRSAGIRVQVNGGTYHHFDDLGKSAVAPGDSVDVYGSLSSPAGMDRVFNAIYVRDRTTGAGTDLKPLGVTQRYLVGRAPAPATPGLPLGKGLYSAGLFVRLAGEVVGTSGADYFFLDDGTYNAGIGVKVVCGALPVPDSGSKIVTGVVGMAGNTPVIYATSIQ